jgi:acetyltransferase-like isoleucine patch superfamily enzyme
MQKLSPTYRFLRAIGLNYSEEEYGQVSLWKVVKRIYKTYRDTFLLKFFMDSWLLSPLTPRLIRPAILKKIGCNVGKNVFIGSQVYFDSGYANLIEIEDYVHVTARCLLLCHERNLSNYYKNDNASKLKYKTGKIILKRGCMIGMNTMIMPGVTVGEGAIVGAYSLVTKDIPPWTIAVGRPAKVVKYIPERKSMNNENIDI